MSKGGGEDGHATQSKRAAGRGVGWQDGGRAGRQTDRQKRRRRKTKKKTGAEVEGREQDETNATPRAR